MCCVEADRARQLKLDELSLQQKENLSAVSQLMAQIQELRDKVTLNNAKEFHDPETASGSGLSQVPSQPTRIPSPRGMISRDSCLLLDTSRIQRIWHRLRAD